MKSYHFTFLLITGLILFSCESQSQVVVNRRISVVNPRYHYHRHNILTTPVVIAPRPRIIVEVLPHDHTVLHVNTIPYYYASGTFYVQEVSENKTIYKEIMPPVGTIVPKLPEPCITLQIEGNTYYQHKNIVYKKIELEGQVKYEIVSTPTSKD